MGLKKKPDDVTIDLADRPKGMSIARLVVLCIFIVLGKLNSLTLVDLLGLIAYYI